MRKVYKPRPESFCEPLPAPKDVMEQMRRLGRTVSVKDTTSWEVRKKEHSSRIRRDGG